MNIFFEIDNKKINIFYNDAYGFPVPVVVLNTYNDDGLDIWNKTIELTNKNFVLVTISNLDWNSEMTPWHIDKIFKNESDYEGYADSYLDSLINNIIPSISVELEKNNIKVDKYIIGGYSLAGLFAIYSLYKTNIFTSAFSCSGSLWYPGFIEYATCNDLKIIPDKLYFSLGNKESKTRNELMSKVEENTKYLEKYYKSKNIKTIYFENEGNHFNNVSLRIARGISWIID